MGLRCAYVAAAGGQTHISAGAACGAAAQVQAGAVQLHQACGQVLACALQCACGVDRQGSRARELAIGGHAGGQYAGAAATQAGGADREVFGCGNGAAVAEGFAQCQALLAGCIEAACVVDVLSGGAQVLGGIDAAGVAEVLRIELDMACLALNAGGSFECAAAGVDQVCAAEAQLAGGREQAVCIGDVAAAADADGPVAHPLAPGVVQARHGGAEGARACVPDEAIGVVECTSLQRQVLGVGGDAAPGVVECAGAQAQWGGAGLFHMACHVAPVAGEQIELLGLNLGAVCLQGLWRHQLQGLGDVDVTAVGPKITLTGF